VQLTPLILMAGESAAASAVEDEHHGLGGAVMDDDVVDVDLRNRDCCCRTLLLMGVPLILVKLLVDVEIAVRSTAGLTLKADVVVIARLP
jgi:hypothetical protein